MRALSVRQPWAGPIAAGVKRLEVRSWPTRYRGRLAICAGMRVDPSRWPAGPTGVAICSVELIDCRPARPGDERAACADGPPGDCYVWELADPRPLPAVPVRGRLGLFEFDIRGG